MPKVFLVSDTHHGHAGICKFKRKDGSKLRPWDDPDKMDEDMIDLWNQTVGPNDKVYHLGDVAINRKKLEIVGKLHGDLVLIKGNHDIFKKADYEKYFRDIRSVHVMNGCLLSHYPIHKSCMGRYGCNIHGHTHANMITILDSASGKEISDPDYFNVCVENTNYKPILFEEVLHEIVANGGTIGFTNHRLDNNIL